MTVDRTQAVLLTPAGRGAVASILVQGPNALQAISGLLRRKGNRALAETPVGNIIYGRWASDQGEDVIVCRRAESAAEIHCHGGIAASAAILEDLQRMGCAVVAWQDWLRETSPGDLKAEAQVALAEARTERTAAILLDQMHGALTLQLQQVGRQMGSGDAQAAVHSLDELLLQAHLGMHLTLAWKVVLCGRPNVGKSSLINRLVGYERTIVFDQPGTTRDAIAVSTAIDGWPVELTDTAGLRDSEDRMEAAGIRRANEQISSADLVLLLFDGEVPPPELVQAIEPAKRLLVRTKCDMTPATNDSDQSLHTSAVTGEGIDELLRAISKKLVPSPPSPGAAVPFRPEHVSLITAARKAFAET